MCQRCLRDNEHLNDDDEQGKRENKTKRRHLSQAVSSQWMRSAKFYSIDSSCTIINSGCLCCGGEHERASSKEGINVKMLSIRLECMYNLEEESFNIVPWPFTWCVLEISESSPRKWRRCAVCYTCLRKEGGCIFSNRGTKQILTRCIQCRTDFCVGCFHRAHMKSNLYANK